LASSCERDSGGLKDKCGIYVCDRSGTVKCLVLNWNFSEDTWL
jgi:hypothetical protein